MKMKKSILIFLMLLMAAAGFCADKSSLKFRFVNDDSNPNSKDCEKITVYEDLKSTDYIVDKEEILDGTYIEEITFGKDYYNMYELSLKLNPEGTRIFAEATENNIGRKLLVQIDNNSLFVAKIMQSISNGSVCIDGLKNLSMFMTIKKSFDCIDNVNIAFDDSDFETNNIYLNTLPKVDLKDPQAVVSVFFYYYKKNNPKWKTFVNEGEADIVDIIRDDFYSTIDEYDIFVQKVSKPVETPLKSILVKFTKPNNVFTTYIKLVEKDGKYFVSM